MSEATQAIQVPGFQLVKPLGAGYGGVVYLGKRIRDSWPVAIKVFTVAPEDAEYPEKFARFRREVSIYQKVHHAAFVPFLEASLDARPAYLVLGWMKGGDLSGYLKRSSSPWEVCPYDLGIRIAGALHALHVRQVLHRDIKPANILLDDHGVAFLGDFGAGLTQQEPRLTQVHVALGTPQYMAPEIQRGAAASVPSELYSLALVLVHLLTQSLPKRGPTGLDSAWEDRVPFRYQPLLPVLRRCLREHPQDRPDSAQWFQDQLREAQLHSSDSDSSFQNESNLDSRPTLELSQPPVQRSQPLARLASEGIPAAAASLASAPVESPEKTSTPKLLRQTHRASSSHLAKIVLGLVLGVVCGGFSAWIASTRAAPRFPDRSEGQIPRWLGEGSNEELRWEWDAPRLRLETPAGELEIVLAEAPPQIAKVAFDAQGGILDLGPARGSSKRRLLAFRPEGTVQWLKQIDGDWRLYPAWLGVQTPHGWVWRERQTGMQVSTLP